MTLVTLIGEKQAREGYEFIFRGPIPDCKECRLKTVCFSLTEGKRYRVKGIRPIKHRCKIHEEEVRIVEVEEVPIDAALPEKAAMEGAVFMLEKPDCDRIGCENYRLCSPVGTKEGGKYKVVSVSGGFDCPDGERMKKIKII